jgi:hypothetical protein
MKAPKQPIFSLMVESSNSATVWPHRVGKEDPAFEERIRAGYYADEDFACVGFDITDMDDLLRILRFYEGSGVEISLQSNVRTEEWAASATLASKYRGSAKSRFRAINTGSISPATAASKLSAIAQGLAEWDRKNGKTEGAA